MKILFFQEKSLRIMTFFKCMGVLFIFFFSKRGQNKRRSSSPTLYLRRFRLCKRRRRLSPSTMRKKRSSSPMTCPGSSCRWETLEGKSTSVAFEVGGRKCDRSPLVSSLKVTFTSRYSDLLQSYCSAAFFYNADFGCCWMQWNNSWLNCLRDFSGDAVISQTESGSS